SFGELRLGQGREAAKQFLGENKDIFQEIEHAVRVSTGLTSNNDTTPEEWENSEESPIEKIGNPQN
ncbi:uncharacterized protein METZ01_LOCUS498963, partial [marine metagenome]